MSALPNLAVLLRRRGIVVSALLVSALLLGIEVVRGVMVYTTPSSLVEFRPFAYAIASLVWMGSIDWSDSRMRREVRGWLLLASVGLLVVATIHLATTGLASSSDFYIDETGIYRSLRPLLGDQACILVAGVLVAAWTWLDSRKGRWLWLTGALALVAVLAQQRSAWIALIVGLVVVIFGVDQQQRSRLLQLGLVTGFIVFCVVLSGVADAVMEQISQSIDAAFGAGSTLIDRTDGWSELVGRAIDPARADWLFGAPFGTGYARIGPNGLLETYSPHNFYVQLFLRSGVLGLLAYLVAVITAISRLWRGRTAPLEVALAAIALTFCIAYGLQWYVAPILGVALFLAPRKLRIEDGAVLLSRRREKRSIKSSVSDGATQSGRSA